MATVHMSEAEAANNFRNLMAHLRAGEEVVLESDSHPPAVLTLVPARGRRLSEMIALAHENSRQLGYTPVMDADFAADMEEIVRNRKPRDTSAWD